MPTPANPNRFSARGGGAKSTPTKQKPLDIGTPLGVYDTNSVREKVRKWQQQGGGVITTNDVYYSDDEENPSPTKTKSEKVNDNDEKSSSTSSSRKRSNSTPRKRVISDEHWRIKRSTAQTPPPKRPSPNRISVYTTNDPLRSPRGPKRDIKTDDKSRPLPSAHNGEKSKTSAPTTPSSKEKRKAKSPRHGDAILESTIEEKDETICDETASPISRSVGAKKHQTREQTEITEAMRRKTPPPEDGIDWEASEADFSELSKMRARGPNLKSRPAPKPPKGGIFTHMLDESKKIFDFARPEPPKPGPNRGAKIEAWLSSTPDPFMDDEEPPVEIPAPLNTKQRRPRDSQKPEASHDTTANSELSIDDENHSRRSANSRRANRKESPPSARARSSDRTTPKDKDIESSSPSSTKRSDTHHRRKSSPKSKEKDIARQEAHGEQLDTSDTETHPFSDGSEVSGNNAPVLLGRKRPFPSTGVHRLSTIASVETLSTRDEGQSQAPPSNVSSELNKSVPPAEETRSSDLEDRDHFDPDSLLKATSKLSRRLTTHDDLISVLSAPNTRSRSIRSARSIRTNKSRMTTATVSELMQELSADEAKYMRELKTLVGGVIPVLLTCVLSRSDSAIAAGLFRPSMDPKDDLNFTKPIVDMGVALERLKTLHKRIPQDNPEALLTWAVGAQRVYREYLKAWRLGFRDVIVNLAPLEEGEATNNSDTKSLDEGMTRDENGDVVDSNGEKVDVAYLLKRPLVRLKYLAKSFKGLNLLQPSSKAEEVAAAYQTLVTDARRRAREERARLEDESAASIDATRARDPMTLGVLTGVCIDPNRRVRARDFFNLSLYHSSGQIMDCRAELLLRDNPPEGGPGGDLLICEIDHADRWLLFPPVDVACVSARNGDAKGEIVVMLRSPVGQEKVWQELLSLKIDEEEIGFEWVQLLGLDPKPPAICRTQSFVARAREKQREQTATPESSPPRRGPPSPSAINVPIGEKALSGARRSLSPKEQFSDPSTVGSSSGVGSRNSLRSTITRESDYASDITSTPKPQVPLPSARYFETGDSKPATGLKRSKAKRISRYGELSPSGSASQPATPSDKDPVTPSTPQQGRHDEAKRFYDSPQENKSPKEDRAPKPAISDAVEQRSQRLSSVPSMDLPIIPKIRKGSSKSYISDSLASEDEDDSLDLSPAATTDEGPAPPPHRSPPSQQKTPNVPILSPTAGRQKRRASSPLKHEYEPSTASDSCSEYSETSTVRHYEMDYSSESSDDDSDDELSSSPPRVEAQDPSLSTLQASIITSATSTLSPSNSASQKGYRTVPSQPSKASKAIASIFAWSDSGSWESLFPDECSIVVGPGLIEAYEMSAVHSDPNSHMHDDDTNLDKLQPLVALELTPLVPIRRGTAIDISIRSPPTERSKITSSSNIMFRSRNPEECEVLYGLINQARINNPTYIALQNARGPFADQPMNFERSTKSGWLGWPRRRRSYRASSSPRSLADASESSVGTMSSAFSALKRFPGSKMFSIARSTVTSQKGGSLHSSSAGSGSIFPPTTSGGIERIAAAIKGADGIGLSNAKIRLYLRETQSKWRDLGAARLTIMPANPEPPRPDTGISRGSDRSASADGPDGSPPASGASSPRREIEPRKRILIRGKTRGEVLLDVCLGESSFERVARTGIAVSVWHENEGGAVSKEGGVTVNSFRVYMIQMKSEAEASYTFGLVGKFRY